MLVTTEEAYVWSETMSIINQETARHYNWGEDCEGWVLLPNADATIIEERMPPGSAEIRHYHVRARQFFYILSGELRMEMEGQVHVIPTGSGLEVPPGSRHQARNDSEAEVRFLVTSSPTSYGDRVDCVS
jgi:mannose-6-phosphate isomerase-like protein (cupin superfamily)